MARRKFYLRVSLLSLLTFFSALLWSQQKPGQPASENQEPEGYKIRAEVNMVNVPVTVRQQRGEFVKGLSKDSFQIFEDGEPQEITFFEQEGVATRIAIVLDISGSVQPEWGSIKYATKRFVEHLKPEDQFSLTTFNTEIKLKMDWGRKIDRVDAVLSSIYCKDETKLWDAIWVVCNDLFKGITEKKAMIIMSDGLDNESAVSYDDALQAAVRSEAAIYVVSKTQAVRDLYMANNNRFYGGVPEGAFAQADLALRKLSYETGGRVLYPNTFGQLDNIYAEVDEELRNQYSLGYISTNAIKDGTYRRIEVKVKAPNATVSARPGYYAADSRRLRSSK